jgi:hypothetical protein
MSNVLTYDCTSDNLGYAPAAQRAGYGTGGPGIQWDTAQWEANPGAIVIDQDPKATDHTADALDIESGAATVDDIPGWGVDALAAYKSGARPGQRMPLVYCSGANVAAVTGKLAAEKFSTDDFGIWLADPSLTLAEAEAKIGTDAGHGFKYAGVQYQWDAKYDVDVFSATWLKAQSGVKGDTLAQGDSGPAVLALQQDLARAGEKLTADGLFGAGTLTVLKSFQTARKLTVDGIAGPSTWKALADTPAPPAPVATVPRPTAVTRDLAVYPLKWLPVVFEGKSVEDYQVKVVQLNGTVVFNQPVKGTTTSLTRLVHGWSYHVSVTAIVTGHPAETTTIEINV